MKLWRPGSLRGRTLLVLFLGLTLSHVISILVFTSEQLETALLTSERRLMERMATVVRLLAEVPVSLHETLLVGMNASGLHFTIHHASWDPAAREHGDDARRATLERIIDHPGVRVLGVELGHPDFDHPHGSWHRLLFSVEVLIVRALHGEAMDRELAAWVRMADGHVVHLVSHPDDHHIPLFRHATISVLIMAGAVLVFSLTFVSSLTRPLWDLSQAVERFGRDLQAPPLREEGPLEVVRVAQVFNDMNRRIRGFVEERLGLLAAISHDLRTPLTRLRLLTESLEPSPEREKMANTLEEMTRMISATLSLARESHAEEARQVLNLAGLVATLCEELQDAGLPVAFAGEPVRILFACRPLGMKRALGNLIENAVRYGHKADVGWGLERESILVTIRDAGTGIPEAEWERVLRPFYRLDPSRNRVTGGAGLGLTIAHAVIREHGGGLSFRFPSDGGFLVAVRLPRISPTKEGVRENPESGSLS